MRILAAKLPNSGFEFCRGLLGGFSFLLFFSPRKKARKNPPKKKTRAKFTRKFVRKNSPRISAEALPCGFVESILKGVPYSFQKSFELRSMKGFRNTLCSAGNFMARSRRLIKKPRPKGPIGDTPKGVTSVSLLTLVLVTFHLFGIGSLLLFWCSGVFSRAHA